jgi:2'-5' RNA ligase
MRCFIAINLDDSLRNEIDESTTGLKTGTWDVKWVPSENLHVTLKFLGETPEDRLKEIHEKLQEISSRHEPCHLHLHSVGLFPDKKRPRVVWIDMEDSEGLIKLQEDVEESFVSIGFKNDIRHFSPHLTIGRVRSLKGKDSLLREMEKLRDKDFGNIGVNKISLMKSELRPTGARYTMVAEYHLNKEEP